jgi:hypothetical protein
MLRWTLLVAVVVLAGCGGSEDEPSPPAGEAPRARLVVREVLWPQPRYIEGTLAFLRVAPVGGGAALVDGPVTDGESERGTEPLFEAVVEPGEYRVDSHQRPCNGNCSLLDAPADRCAATVKARSGETLVATVVLAQSGGCEIREERR